MLPSKARILVKGAKNVCVIKSENFSSNISNNAQVEVNPTVGFMDTPPDIVVRGLNSQQKVTLWNTCRTDAGIEFYSHAHYVADNGGEVKVRSDKSHGGTYTGIFKEGLVSAMRTSPLNIREKPKLKWARMFQKDVSEPFKYNLSVIDDHVNETELYENCSGKICETDFHRNFLAHGVKRFEVEEKDIRGALYVPDREGPLPVVIDLFGAEPGLKEFRSAMISSYGYLTLSLPYYGYKDLPKLKDRLNLDYFMNALDYIYDHPRSNKHGVGILGSCKGGELGIVMAALSKKVKALVTINCYSSSIDLDFYYKNELYRKGFKVSPQTSIFYKTKQGELVVTPPDDFFRWDYPSILPIEQIHDDCSVLIATGDCDPGHSHRAGITLQERSRKFKKDNVALVVYPKTGHAMDPPFHPHASAVWNNLTIIRDKDGNRVAGVPQYYGGDSYYHCQATKDLWNKILTNFHRKLVQEAGLDPEKTHLYTPYTKSI